MNEYNELPVAGESETVVEIDERLSQLFTDSGHSLDWIRADEEEEDDWDDDDDDDEDWDDDDDEDDWDDDDDDDAE
jgi:hypothetical protein